MDSNEFKHNLVKILEINNQLDAYKQEMDKLKSQKANIEKNLIVFFEENNMTNNNIIVNNNKIKYSTQKNYETFSKKYLTNNIYGFLKDKKIAEELVEHLYNNRNIKESKSIKITNNK